MKKVMLVLFSLGLLMGCSNSKNTQGVSQNLKKEERRIHEKKEEQYPILIQNKEGSYQYITPDGNVLLPGPYDIAKPFSDGLAFVEQMGASFFIDIEGKKILEVDYDEVGDFHNGLARIMLHAKGNEGYPRYGFINKNGDIIINPTYFYTTNFSEEKAIGLKDNEQEGKWEIELLNNDGTVTKLPDIPASNVTEFHEFSEGVSVIFPSRIVPSAYMINREGQLISEGEYSYIGELKNGLAPFAPHSDTYGEDLYGYINSQGEIVIEPRFSDALPFDGEVTFAMDNGRWGVINREGNWLSKPSFEYVGRYSEGLAAVKIGEFWGYVNTKGEMVIEPQFGFVGQFEHGLAMVQVGDRTGLIDTNGTYVLPPGKILLYENMLSTKENNENVNNTNTEDFPYYFDSSGQAHRKPTQEEIEQEEIDDLNYARGLLNEQKWLYEKFFEEHKAEAVPILEEVITAASKNDWQTIKYSGGQVEYLYSWVKNFANQGPIHPDINAWHGILSTNYFSLNDVLNVNHTEIKNDTDYIASSAEAILETFKMIDDELSKIELH
ncbi:WG repeat-containing protein [Bacillus sp. FJAT-29937]|uniref:WG repeat-containing protein n=1 Tax=Bacillus sp. FJAT-29937 TaxID=1720553 RepID=UPI000833EA21|nr:WG repeat-containing protein [Bacillus sp. FJAT-29937]